MKVLVTGANGLLGHHVVAELLSQRHTVCIVVRSCRDIHFDLESVEVHQGDFTDYGTLKNAAAGCDAIIHLAAVTATNLRRYNDYRKINIEGTKQVARVSNELEIKNIVYASTANTIGYGNEQHPGDENSPALFPFTASWYAQSKIAAEEIMMEASELPGRHVVIINPTFLVGKYDTKPSSGKLLLAGYRKRLMFVPGGGKNFVAASDVATCVCNALTQGKNGGRYLACGENLSFREFYRIQQQVGNYRQSLVGLPGYLLAIMGRAGNILRALGIGTSLCSMNTSQLLIREYYTGAKARAELGLPEADIRKALEEAIGWFVEKGKIRKI
ncbi:MAG TPA: NAD-dependent epimerase/dehydratase family protein [Paludibacter sp.]|nr:NAD-dependent epimerase/dehydratase family protein [Paludibacter sp.]